MQRGPGGVPLAKGRALGRRRLARSIPAHPGLPARPRARLLALVRRRRRRGHGEIGDRGEQAVEIPGDRGPGAGAARLRLRLRLVLGAELVEPRQMRQQQPRIEAPPHRDHLAVVEHRLLHAFKRALGQHCLGMGPRQCQRRAPAGGKSGIAPPRQINPRTRNPGPRRRHPNIAVARQLVDKAGLARRREHRIGNRLLIPLRGEDLGATPLPGHHPPALGDAAVGIVGVHGGRSFR